MIVGVCLNPALDLTYRIQPRDAGLVPSTSHRVSLAGERAGGKATNVVRVLGQLGARARLIAPLAGATGEAFGQEAQAAGLEMSLVPHDEPTRRTIAIVDCADATLFNDAGPPLSPSVWRLLTDAVERTLSDGDVLVLAGSVPPQAPVDAYAQLVRLAHRAGARVVLDAAGEQLRAALREAPDLVKPNAVEAGELLGEPLASRRQVQHAAAQLRADGAVAALISRGREGLVASAPAGVWSAHSPHALIGNPTGAGDSLTAVVALAMHRSRAPDWPAVLADGVATSASAVTMELAGEIDLATRDRLLPDVVVEELA